MDADELQLLDEPDLFTHSVRKMTVEKSFVTSFAFKFYRYVNQAVCSVRYLD